MNEFCRNKTMKKPKTAHFHHWNPSEIDDKSSNRSFCIRSVFQFAWMAQNEFKLKIMLHKFHLINLNSTQANIQQFTPFKWNELKIKQNFRSIDI